MLVRGLPTQPGSEARDYLKSSSLFGISPKAHWKPWARTDQGSALSKEELAVGRAYLQHRYVFGVRRIIEDEHDGEVGFADELGVRVRYVREKLSRAAPMGMDDCTGCALALRVEAIPEFMERGHLLPPDKLVDETPENPEEQDLSEPHPGATGG